jgi:hypothetical protein
MKSSSASSGTTPCATATASTSAIPAIACGRDGRVVEDQRALADRRRGLLQHRVDRGVVAEDDVDALRARHGLGRAPGHAGAEALERAGLVQAAVPHSPCERGRFAPGERLESVPQARHHAGREVGREHAPARLGHGHRQGARPRGDVEHALAVFDPPASDSAARAKCAVKGSAQRS